MTAPELLERLNSPKTAELFSSLYGETEIDAARQRYRRLINEFPEASGGNRGDFRGDHRGDLRLFSVPGRAELGGNHTDHNRGKVLAASIQLDAAAVVAPRRDKQVFFRSAGHRDIKVDLSDLAPREEEKGETEALVRGIAAEFAARGTPVNGFTANAANAVLTGSGLSSSAAVEILFAKIFDNLYRGGETSALELAKIAQKAENIYFGKPCGLMDQVACASGGVIAIDFEDSMNPQVMEIAFDPAAVGFALCVVNTKGSHSDLIPDYAAIPAEMKSIAAFFGKQVLRELDEKTFLAHIPELRKAAGDRAVLRAIHFFSENRRVDAMLTALQSVNRSPNAMETFLSLVRESGDSSWEFLQNIYSPRNPGEQGLSIALAMTKKFLDGGSSSGANNGACRVHGGGFAGTIQVFLPVERLEEYRALMEGIFGKGALTVLRIRSLGAVELHC